MIALQITSRIAGQTGEKIITSGLNHDQTFHETHPIQLSMIQKHLVP